MTITEENGLVISYEEESENSCSVCWSLRAYILTSNDVRRISPTSSVLISSRTGVDPMASIEFSEGLERVRAFFS